MNQSGTTAAIVEPYAEALFGLGEDLGLTDRFNGDIAGVIEAVRSSEDLRQVMVNPFVKPEAKKAVLSQIFGSQLEPNLGRFINLLVDRRRLMYIVAICEQYQTLVRQSRNIILANVISTVELTDAQRQSVIDKVKSMTGASQVELETSLDPELIGGVIIKIGSQVLDASIRGQLRRLTNSLISSAA